MWKLRFYHKTGFKRGDLLKEEIFDSREECRRRYQEVFVFSDFALNPTIWFNNGSGYKRYFDDFVTAAQ